MAAFVRGRDAINYTRLSAIKLEQLVDPVEVSAYPVRAECAGTFKIVAGELVRYVAKDLVAGPSVLPGSIMQLRGASFSRLVRLAISPPT